MKLNVLTICCLTLCVCTNLFADLTVGTVAPDIVLPNLQGNAIKLKDYTGKKIVYLYFWATWCTICKEEIKNTKEFYNKYKDKNLAIIGIAVKEPVKKVIQYVEKNQIPWTILMDEKTDVAQNYQVRGFPLNILIDGEGKIQYIGNLPPKNLDDLISKFVPKVDQPKSTPSKIKKLKK